uniref:Ig-like domain-containing protein n=1 Tax=Paramormyrops kingsleyae TaxID=1676925 RepID=A0A3B3SRZ8_9TELE
WRRRAGSFNFPGGATSPMCSKVKTFDKLSAQAGGSISIPCFYGEEHREGVKSWCKGKDTSSCSSETRSDSLPAMNRVFITDDPQNFLFIVTMRNLQHMDSGSYWCCVGDGCRRSEDSSGKLELLVSTGASPCHCGVSSGFSGFPPQSKNILRLIGVARFPTGMNGVSALCWIGAPSWLIHIQFL